MRRVRGTGLITSRLSRKLTLWFALIALVPLASVATLAYVNAVGHLRKQVTTDLLVTAEAKAKTIETYLIERQQNVTTLSRTPSIVQAMKRLRTAFTRYGLDSPEYAAVDRQLRPFLTYYRDASGYADLFLVSPEGDAVFSVNRGEDLGSNYKTGFYCDSQLAKVFDNANTLLETEVSAFEYYQATNEPAAFIAAPVMEEGTVVGVVVLQMSNQEIYALAQDYAGLGKTGETLIGSRLQNEAVFLAPARHDPYAAFRRRIALESPVDWPLQQAVQGKKGQGVTVDYRGIPVLATWRYLPSPGWGMVVKIDAAEAFAPIVFLRDLSFGIGLAAALLVGVFALGVSKSIADPIVQLTTATRRIAGGDLTQRASATAKDEIGELAGSFNTMAARLQERTASLEDANKELRLQIAERKQAEARMEAALREKEILLKEIHHRVKNNLQMICSLLDLQVASLKRDQERTVLHDCRLRVRSMALIHEQLYRSTDLASIDFSQYVRRLSDMLLRSYKDHANTVALEMDLAPVQLGMEAAIPCGLILTELVSNALKHAFPGGRSGVILLSLQCDQAGNVVLSVSDNGVGVPAQLDVRQTDTLGLRLVNGLTEQLGGTLGLTCQEKTQFTLTFPAFPRNRE